MKKWNRKFFIFRDEGIAKVFELQEDKNYKWEIKIENDYEGIKISWR